MNKRALSMLSICQKAGKLRSGEFACEKSLQSGESVLIIIAKDASDNTKKKFLNKAYFYKIDAYTFSSKQELSQSIGKVNISTISINDLGFAKKIKEYIDILENNENN